MRGPHAIPRELTDLHLVFQLLQDDGSAFFCGIHMPERHLIIVVSSGGRRDALLGGACGGGSAQRKRLHCGGGGGRGAGWLQAG
jgi:hypothetical protein